jgi:hypothetical protein
MSARTDEPFSNSAERAGWPLAAKRRAAICDVGILIIGRGPGI